MISEKKVADIDSEFHTRYVKSASYEELMKTINLEEICKGRQACILTEFVGSHWYVVRSTTQYKNFPQKIQDIHYLQPEFETDMLDVEQVDKGQADREAHTEKRRLRHSRMNVMLEVYDKRYQSMAYHSDMAIDLDGPIKILSLYPNGEKRRRELHIKNKQTSEVTKIILQDHMLVTFSLDTNKKFLHRIVGQAQWMGLTCRISKTLSNSLRLATESEKKELFSLRSMENNFIDFQYPELNYTLNPTDISELIS